MSLKSNIQEVVESLGVTFMYGRKYDININGDDAVFPAIVLLEPDQPGFRINSTTGSVYSRDNIFIQFITQIVMGEQAENRLTDVESMKLLCVKFLRALNASNKFESFSENIPGVLLVDYYDVNVTGIEINISALVPTQPYSC